MYADSAVSFMRQKIASGYPHCNSSTLIAAHSQLLSNSNVRTIDDIRLANLRLLIEDAGGQRALADKIGKAPAQISQWINRAPIQGTGRPRRMQTDTARDIEKKLHLPTGWMDRPNLYVPGAAADRSIAEPQTQYLIDAGLRPDQIVMLELWEALGDKDRKTLQAVGDALAKPHPSGNAGGGSSTS